MSGCLWCADVAKAEGPDGERSAKERHPQCQFRAGALGCVLDPCPNPHHRTIEQLELNVETA